VIVGGIVVVGGVGVVRSFSRFETVDHDHGGLSLFGQQTGLVLFFTEEKWIFLFVLVRASKKSNRYNTQPITSNNDFCVCCFLSHRARVS
jgi:hypothetical protein